MPRLINAGQLAERLQRNDRSRIVIIDCRADLFDASAGFRAYCDGHLPGARFIDLATDLADPAGIDGRHPLPERERFRNVLECIGVSNSSIVVAYDDSGCTYAARLWWMIRWMGHANVCVLNGGFSAWLRDYPVDIEAPEVISGHFEIGPPLTKQLTRADVESYDGLLLDARSRDRFDGKHEPVDHTAGHIPGARCHPYTDNLTQEGSIRLDFDHLQKYRTATSIACYCGSGVTAAHNVLVFTEAGFDEPALYAGSWSEWIEHPNADQNRKHYLNSLEQT